jgi:uroporphyrinogen III methyltransferase/synthase
VSKPLKGKRVLVTRAAEQNEDFSRQLTALGADPVELPTIRLVPPDDTAPLQAALARLIDYHWLIFTSVNGVDFFYQALAEAGVPLTNIIEQRLAAIGPATAAALVNHGLKAEIVAADHVAEGLLAAMPAVTNQRILIPTADIARSTLSDGLRAAGASVDQIAVYQNKPAFTPAGLIDLLPTLDILTLTC